MFWIVLLSSLGGLFVLLVIYYMIKDAIRDSKIKKYSSKMQDVFSVSDDVMYLRKQDAALKFYIELFKYFPKTTTDNQYSVTTTDRYKFKVITYDKSEMAMQYTDIKKIVLENEELVKLAKEHRVSSLLKGKELIVKKNDSYSATAVAYQRAGMVTAAGNQVILDNIDTYPTLETSRVIIDFLCGKN